MQLGIIGMLMPVLFVAGIVIASIITSRQLPTKASESNASYVLRRFDVISVGDIK